MSAHTSCQLRLPLSLQTHRGGGARLTDLDRVRGAKHGDVKRPREPTQDPGDLRRHRTARRPRGEQWSEDSGGGIDDDEAEVAEVGGGCGGGVLGRGGCCC